MGGKAERLETEHCGEDANSKQTRTMCSFVVLHTTCVASLDVKGLEV